MIDETLPWLTFPAAVDLSNTIVVTPRGDVDLLSTDEQLDVWIAAERGRVACVNAAAGRLEDVRALRADLRALLYAYAEGHRLPGPARRRINALSAAAPAYPVLHPGGGVASSKPPATPTPSSQPRWPARRSSCSTATTRPSIAPRPAADSSTHQTTPASAGAAAPAATVPG